MSIKVHSFLVGPLGNIQYVIENTNDQSAIIVDPAWDKQLIINQLNTMGLNAKGIVLTHTHHDHVSALNDILNDLGELPVFVGKKELALGLFELNHPNLLDDGDIFDLAGLSIKVIETPGHTKGSLCFLIEHHLIAGDTLFIDGCGRCDFKESDISQMFSSLQKLKQLDDKTVVHPGHHYGSQQSATIAEQKQTNPYLLIEDEAFFMRFRSELQSLHRSIPFAPSSTSEMAKIYASHL